MKNWQQMSLKFISWKIYKNEQKNENVFRLRKLI